MKKVGICFFLGSLAIGGTQKNVVNILKNIDRTEFEPALCCFFSGGPFEDEIKHLNIPTLICNFLRVYDLRVYFRIIRFLRGSDVVHCFGYPTIYFGVLLGRLVGVKRIIVGIQDRDVWKKWYHIFLDKLIRPLVDLYIADGKGTNEYAIKQQGIHYEDIITLYDGADIDALKVRKARDEIRSALGISNDVPVAGVICRLDDKKKGVSYFLKALPAILEKCPDAKFLVVGDGEDRNALEELSYKLNIQKSVVFTGFRNDLADILNAIDVFVIPSLWESIPKILIDAMAMGKTVVATNSGDIPELLTDGKSGILVNPKDHHGLADAVSLLIRNKTTANELGKAALRTVEKEGLALEKSVKMLETRYREVSRKNVSFPQRIFRYIYLSFLLPCVATAYFAVKLAEDISKRVGVTR